MNGVVEVSLNDSDNMFNYAREECKQLTEGRLAVYIVGGVIFGAQEDYGIVKEIDHLPRYFNYAESITITIVYADQKEPLTLKYYYEK